MSDKDAAKRRRQARNRQERINRQKRIEGARRSESRPSRTADAGARPARGAAAAGRGGRPSRTATEAPAPGGILGKLFPPRPAPAARGDGDAKAPPARGARTPMPRHSVVVDVDVADATGIRAELLRRSAQPGGRPALIGAVLAVVVTVLLFTAPLAAREAFEGYGRMVVRQVPQTEVSVDERLKTFEEDDPVVFGTERLTESAPLGLVLGVAGILLASTLAAAWSLTRPTRSRTLMLSTFALAIVSFFLGIIPIVIVVAVLGFATFKSRQADRAAAIEGLVE